MPLGSFKSIGASFGALGDGGGGGAVIQYLFRDLFTADLSAGSVNATPSSDGKTTRAAIDTESKLSIFGQTLNFYGGKASAAYGDPGLSYPAEARVAGKAIIANVPVYTRGTYLYAGWNNAASGLVNGGGALAHADGTLRAACGNWATLGLTGYITFPVMFIHVLRSAGSFLISKIGGSYRLEFIDRLNTTATMYPTAYSFAAFAFVDLLAPVQLPAPFDTDYGLATQYLADARSNGDTLTHEANCIMAWAETTRANGQQVAFRMQDADNYWRVDVAGDGSMALQEVVAGVATSRGTAAANSVINGDYIEIIADGSTIEVYAKNTRVITYASANNFKTATGAKILSVGTGGAISGWSSWPRILTGTAKSILDRYTSYTKPAALTVIGDSISEMVPGWPQQVAAARGMHLLNHATSGATILNAGTYQYLSYQVDRCTSDNASIIILALGRNELNSSNMATVQAEIEAKIDTLRASNPNATIYYLNVLPTWTDNTGATEVDKSPVRTAVAAACTAKSVTCWDMYTLLLAAGFDASKTIDGTHLTAVAGGGNDMVASIVIEQLAA